MQRFVRLKALQDKSLSQAEEDLADLRSIAAAKDKKITQMEKEVNSLEKQIMVAEIQANKAEMEATDEAKVYVARAILQARIKIAQEDIDPGFDRSAWDVAGWKQTLLELGGDAEPKQVKALEAGPSGVKEVKEGGEGGAGAAEGDAAEVGNEG
ncbi:hypothetical protein HanPI659440_Chr10g0382021 [Helianthus annuus]|nr:hypothetical protein HanPI659440_Chr10g0382021 [Helianthus annuus]